MTELEKKAEAAKEEAKEATEEEKAAAAEREAKEEENRIALEGVAARIKAEEEARSYIPPELKTGKGFRISEIRARMGELEQYYGGLSNVPCHKGSEYYTLKDELQVLQTNP